MSEESGGFPPAPRYDFTMNTDVEASRARTPIRQKLTAGAILIVAAGLAIWIFIGIIKTIFFIALGVAIVIAVLWALKTIVW